MQKAQAGARWCRGVRSGDDARLRGVPRLGLRRPRRPPSRRRRGPTRRRRPCGRRRRPQTYNLDHDVALATFRQAVAADPSDAGAYRGLATSLWLSITFRRGNMTVDDYLGRAEQADRLSAPAAAARNGRGASRNAIETAIAIARKRDRGESARRGRALPARRRRRAARVLHGHGRGQRDGRVSRRARGVRRTRNRCCRSAPQRKDAGLIVGTYRYIVSTLSLPVRWVAYVAGFGGGRERGLQLVEEAAAYRRRQPGRRALRAHAAVQPREAVRRCAEAAGGAQRGLSRAIAWCGSRAARRCFAPAGRRTRSGSSPTASRASPDDRRPRMFGEDALVALQARRGARRAGPRRRPTPS